MAYDIGVRLGVDGEKAFRDSIKAINSNIKAMGSELKAVTAQFAQSANSEEALAAKNQVLAKSITATKEKIGVLDKQLASQAEKLRSLGQALDDVTAAHGAESQEALNAQNAYNRQAAAVAKLQDQLNNANAELADMENALKDNAEAMSETTNYVEKFGDSLKNGLAVAAKTAVASIAAIGAATTAFVKSSIGEFSNYEQLTGGVETLFKSSSAQVQAYAQNAFKTAGLSANEYMETVTSFSASLLQGLGGDTAKAAELADLAITDMSDNANKMGTDMASIQNAYQGFAKQNYTMLDNLKLGYGGTQEEMIRLINDSGILNEEIKNLDNVTFDQMIQAIHEVQTQIGITGTTALEAESTIQGSTAVMKSAWDNLVTGIATDDQDIGQLVENFASSVETAAGNVFPRIGIILRNIGPMIGEFFQTNLVAQAPKMISAGGEFVVSLASGITQGLPDLRKTVSLLTENLSQYVRDNLPEFISSGLDLVAEMASSIRENAGMLVDSGIQLVTSLAQGLADSFPTIIEKLPGIVSDIAGVINDNAPKILAAGVNIAVTLGKGLIQSIPALVKNIPAIIKAVVDVFSAYNWINLGGTIINKLGNGIKNMANFAKTSAGTIKDVILSKIKELPSALMNVGKDMIKKLWEGIKSMGSWLKSQLGGFISNAISAVTGGSNTSAASSSGTSRQSVSRAAPAMLSSDAPVLFRAMRMDNGVSAVQTLQSSISSVGEDLRTTGALRRVRQDIDNTAASVASYYSAQSEARQNAQNTISGASEGVTAAELAAAIRQELNGMKVEMDGRTVGRLTAKQQNDMGRAFGTA